MIFAANESERAVAQKILASLACDLATVEIVGDYANVIAPVSALELWVKSHEDAGVAETYQVTGGWWWKVTVGLWVYSNDR